MTRVGTVPPLSLARLAAAEWSPSGGGAQALLGAVAYGAPMAGADAMLATVLSSTGAMVDAWSTTGPVETGRCGRVHWRHNGHWMYGAIDVDESAQAADLTALTRSVYEEIFEALGHTGCRHLQRFWNYLPRINADGGGLERYRQFNAGRQMAFLNAGHAAFEGAPAACALGTREGPLCVRFLSAATPAVAVENPRQVSAYHYPNSYGPRSPTFSRAVLVNAGPGRAGLLISGTASIVGHVSVHLGDVQAQTHETIANLRAVIDAAHQRGSARFDLSELDCIVYVRHAEQAPVVRAVFEAAVGAGSRAARSAVYLEADICRHELLVEIEAHGITLGEVDA